MPINIITADHTHIPIIQQLAHTTWHHSYKEMISVEQIAYMLDKFYATASLTEQMYELGHRFLLIMDDDAPVGFASYELNAEPSSTAKLHKLYLLPDRQSKGLGKMLINEVMAQAQANQQERLILNVNRNNKAVKFYLSNGFSIISEVDLPIGNGYYMNDYIMEQSLVS